MEFVKEIKNTKADYYVIAKVEAGKRYKITAKADNRIFFRYAIMPEDFSSRTFLGRAIEVYMGTFTHILTATETGNLVIDSLTNKEDYWQSLVINNLEEV